MDRRVRTARSKGAVAVEFALVLPLFLLMVFGTIDFGYFLYVSEVVTNAAR
jgi:Flp pilus assembly protein TadG